MRLDTNGYYALGIPVYVALMLLEAAYFRRRGAREYPLARTLSNLSTSMGAVVLGLFLAPLYLGLYDFGFEHLALVRWPERSPVPWLLGVVMSDFCYYWQHRAGHTLGGLWAIHNVHHQCDRFDLSVALRHPWLSDLYAIPFYALMPMLGVDAVQFFVGVSIVSFYALSIHTPMLDRPRILGLGGVLVTPATHVVHHAKNPRYLNHNYGAMFTLWDRLFGTHVELDPDDPPQLGIARGYPSHDGNRAQWIGFRDLIDTVRLGSSWRERLMALLGPPGWHPEGKRLAPRRAPPADASLSPLLRAYVLVQFALLVLLTAYLLWLRERHSLPFQLGAAAIILVGISSLGGLLDGRRGARRLELIRVAASAGGFGLLLMSG